MASYDTGYEDELFQHPVGPSFHCGICYNVVKNPVMCRHNEHLFCRACITRHLMNSQTCPSCLEPLTVDTLSQPSRTVMNLLSELKVRCHFFNRGCEKFIELGNLDRHVADCGFAPAVCSNEGCRVEVNKQDLLHHETSVCEQRRVQCHSCSDIRQEMNVVKDHLATVNVKLSELNEKFDRNEKRGEENMIIVEENTMKVVKEDMKAVKDDVVAKVELVQEQLKKQEESNRQLKADNVEMKKSLSEITKELKRMTQQTSHEIQVEREHEKKGIAEADGMDGEPKIVLGGGWNGGKSLNSVEMFSLSKSTWKPLQSMKSARDSASSVFYNNHIFVSGGFCGGILKSIEKLSMNAIERDQPITWENCPAELPRPLDGHCTVVYDGRWIAIGGRSSKQVYCDSITEVSLDPLYTSKVLATMPQARWLHCVVLFDGKIVILGGKKSGNFSTNVKSVLLYDIAENECEELAPLPYQVSQMAAVKWGDDNVILVGGMGSDGKPLNKVLMYNIKTQTSYILPDMKYFRRGCVAAVIRDTVIVMGGLDKRNNCLKSVECFKFDRFTWEELPEMREARCGAFAVVF